MGYIPQSHLPIPTNTHQPHYQIHASAEYFSYRQKVSRNHFPTSLPNLIFLIVHLGLCCLNTGSTMTAWSPKRASLVCKYILPILDMGSLRRRTEHASIHSPVVHRVKVFAAVSSSPEKSKECPPCSHFTWWKNASVWLGMIDIVPIPAMPLEVIPWKESICLYTRILVL